MGHDDGAPQNGLSWPLSMMAAVIWTHLHGLVRLGVLVVLLEPHDGRQRHQDALDAGFHFPLPVHTAVAGACRNSGENTGRARPSAEAGAPAAPPARHAEVRAKGESPKSAHTPELSPPPARAH